MIKKKLIKSNLSYLYNKNSSYIINQKIKFYIKIFLKYINYKNNIKITQISQYNQKILINQYLLLGSGLSNQLYKNNLIINFNQKHWYIITIPKGVIILIIKKYKNILYSNNTLLINKIINILKYLKKFNYYKGKGINKNLILKKQKILLKKNEKKNYL